MLTGDEAVWTSPLLPTPGRGTGQALEYQGKKRKTRRKPFLERMGGLVPWLLLEDCPASSILADPRCPTQIYHRRISTQRVCDKSAFLRRCARITANSVPSH